MNETAGPERGNPNHQQPTNSKQYVFRNCSAIFRFVAFLCFSYFKVGKENANRRLRSITNNLVIELVTKPITHLKTEIRTLCFLVFTLPISYRNTNG